MGKTVNQLRIENAIKHIDYAINDIKNVELSQFEKTHL